MLTGAEKKGLGYESEYGASHNSWLWLHEANSKVEYSAQEFDYEIRTNEVGFRDKRIKKKQPGNYRIVAVGDSFTEGIGAPADSSWPALLENRLSKSFQQEFDVLNAGVFGSDPFYYVMLFDSIITKLNPDLVVVAINSADLLDVKFRGGMERFSKGNRTVYKSAPWYEFFYRSSHFFRLVIETCCKRDRNQNPNKEIRIALEILRDKSLNLGTRLTVVSHPWAEECFDNDQDIYAEIIPDGVAYISLWNQMSQTIDQKNHWKYAWPIDGHYNPSGYELMADLIFEQLEGQLTRDGLFEKACQ